MNKPDTKPHDPFDDFASNVLKFSPKGLWRTYLAVWRAGAPGEESLATAIATQNRTVILSPFQYITATFGLAAIAFWLVQGLTENEFGRPESLSFLDPDMIPLILWPLVFAFPLHFLLGAGRLSGSLVNGIWDGVWKIFQLLMYMLGHFIIFFMCVVIGVGLGGLFGGPMDAIIAAGIGLGGACFTVYPMLVRTMPETLGELYGANPGWAGFSAFALCMAMFAAYELITTGRLPD